MILLAIISVTGPALIIEQFISGGVDLTFQGIEEFLPIVFLVLFTTTACIVIFLSFRNTASSEIFFFYIFIFSFIFDVFKTFNFDLYGMTATRIIYYGRFLGALAIFCAGLFTTGVEYRRMGIATVIIIALPAALVLVLPVDITAEIPGGTYAIGSFIEITVTVSVLQLMGFLNFLIAGMKNESRIYKIIAASMITAVCGRELMFYFSDFYFTAGGLVLLITGSIITSLKIHSLYLWD